MKKRLDKMKKVCVRWGRLNSEGGTRPRLGGFLCHQFIPRLPVSARAGALPLERKQVSGTFILSGESPGIA